MEVAANIRLKTDIFALRGYFLQFECSTSHFDFLPARRFLPQTVKFARAGKISNNNQSERASDALLHGNFSFIEGGKEGERNRGAEAEGKYDLHWRRRV